MNVVYVTGNDQKAKYFSEMVGFDLSSAKLKLDEIQSMSLSEIAEHKARQAYGELKRPVLVEDTKLTFNALGKLPGTYIKWFQQEIGMDGLCKILEGFDDRSASAGAAIAYFDGETMKVFERELAGSIATEPRGDENFGWNPVFIPDGSDKTFGEMSDQEFKFWYAKVKPFDEIVEFLKSIDNL